MKKITPILAIIVLSGCARFNSTVTERTLLDGTKEKETVVRAWTLFDSSSELAKVSSSQTDKTQKVEVGALNQQSSSTNLVVLVEAVVGAAVKAAVKP